MAKKQNNASVKWLGIIFLFVIVAVVIVFVFILNSNRETEEVVITGNATVAGVSYKNDTLISPLLVDAKADSYNNKISATFSDDRLRSISYYFVGTYDSSETASFADGMAVAKYNNTKGNYGIKEAAFSYAHSTEDTLLKMTLTADSGGLSSTVAPLFLLKDVSAFPVNLDSFVDAYEKGGFVCEVTK